MGYCDPVREPGADASRDLLAAAVALGDHLDVLAGATFKDGIRVTDDDTHDPAEKGVS